MWCEACKSGFGSSQHLALHKSFIFTRRISPTIDKGIPISNSWVPTFQLAWSCQNVTRIMIWYNNWFIRRIWWHGISSEQTKPTSWLSQLVRMQNIRRSRTILMILAQHTYSHFHQYFRFLFIRIQVLGTFMLTIAIFGRR